MSPLDATFAALADPTRRAMVGKLRRGEANISSLAKPHAMTLSGAFKPIRVLQRAGLVACDKRGTDSVVPPGPNARRCGCARAMFALQNQNAPKWT
jgi:DNA-binding transcriptional ArsR family regulator